MSSASNFLTIDGQVVSLSPDQTSVRLYRPTYNQMIETTGDDPELDSLIKFRLCTVHDEWRKEHKSEHSRHLISFRQFLDWYARMSQGEINGLEAIPLEFEATEPALAGTPTFCIQAGDLSLIGSNDGMATPLIRLMDILEDPDLLAITFNGSYLPTRFSNATHALWNDRTKDLGRLFYWWWKVETGQIEIARAQEEMVAD